MSDMAAVKLLVTIVDRGKGHGAVDIYRSNGLHFDYLCMGLGTANSRILDYFGLSETEKDVVFTLVPGDRVRALIALVNERYHLSHPGRGIMFTLPLSGVSGQVPGVLCKGRDGQEEGANKLMDNTAKYDLVMVVANRGSLDTVIDAARAAGASGGTVLHARRVGLEDGENLFGFTLQPEKEIVSILTPRAMKLEIMRAVNKAAGLSTECGGILFSLPVEDMMGIQPAFDGPAEEL